MAKGIVLVDPYCTGLELVADLNGCLQVLGVYSGCQSIGRIVSKSNNLLKGLKLGNGGNRTKDLTSKLVFFMLIIHIRF